jgi:serine/threonine protein kinase
MRLADAAVERLQEALDWPDLSATRYEPIEALGRGGMGTVYRALDRELGREVAVKIVRGTDTAPSTTERLLREARVLARLEHPGLVPVHDAGVLPDGRAFYVMRLVRGTCLDTHVTALGPRLAPRLRLFERVCDAVAFAHAHGVVHRDLKPENVMVGPFGEVLVMDWGVARVLGAEEGTSAGTGTPMGMLPVQAGTGTGTGTVLGTPGYMAPEQASGDAGIADQRADVYALGAILHFLCVDAAPEAAGGAGLREAAGRLGRTVPRPLAAIVEKALAGDRERRYPHVSGLQRDVAAFLAAEPVSVHRESLLERLGRLLDKYRTAVLLVLAYLVMRMALLLWEP